MICFFADADPAWVFAELEEGFGHFTEYKSDGGHDPKTDPAASAYIHFANGVRAYYSSLKISMPGSQFGLVCDKARIEVLDRGVMVIQGTTYTEWARASLLVDEYMYTYQLAALAELIHVMEEGGELISPAPG